MHWWLLVMYSGSILSVDGSTIYRYGVACTTQGSLPLTTDLACNNAASQLPLKRAGKKWDGKSATNHNKENRPYGCWWSAKTGNLYLNLNPDNVGRTTGAGSSLHDQICDVAGLC